jgi:hypothetical protein
MELDSLVENVLELYVVLDNSWLKHSETMMLIAKHVKTIKLFSTVLVDIQLVVIDRSSFHKVAAKIAHKDSSQ